MILLLGSSLLPTPLSHSSSDQMADESYEQSMQAPNNVPSSKYVADNFNIIQTLPILLDRLDILRLTHIHWIDRSTQPRDD